ncbi:FadR/GntR family transcriptional regulator [Corynebacterium glaucum]|uniref:FadR/GntR family transcriptional regulator n=1 Tax=Corynebacterium glaucum TaxID=187491 RepID=UPI002657E476|nr:FadR/GntR family transcriptional regulator [Corynebacterium glaucum]
MRKDLVSAGVEKVIGAIADGIFKEGEALPSEQALADYLEISRPTMREVVRTLADRGVVEVVHGKGTFVRFRSEWRDVETLVEVLRKQLPQDEMNKRLTEVRRMIEVGSSGHAAENRSEEDIKQMESCLRRYAAADIEGDVAGANAADVDFHNALLRATGNPFLLAVMRPLEGALAESRAATTSNPEVRRRASMHHRTILDAVTAGDPDAAKQAMRAHMDQTWSDLQALGNRAGHAGE